MNEWDRDKLKIELNEEINEILGNMIKCTEKEKITDYKALNNIWIARFTQIQSPGSV